MIKVIVASPSYDGKYDVRYMDSLIKTVSECPKHNIKILPYFLCYDSLIQKARNDYFYAAYKSQADVLFFIDSDIGWNSDDFIKLVKSEKDMIGGTYRKKTEDEELYAFKVMGKDSSDWNLNYDENGLLEIMGIGCGFLKLSRRCYNKLWENEKKFYVDSEKTIKNICDCVITDQNNFVSEDITMCMKWIMSGEKCYLDTNISLSHTGIKEYGGNVRKWIDDWKIKLNMVNNEQLIKSNSSDKSINLEKYFDTNSQNDDQIKDRKENINNAENNQFEDLFNIL